jgi:hypothetical protein
MSMYLADEGSNKVSDRPKPEHHTFAEFMDMERGRLQQHAQGKMADAIGRALPGESQKDQRLAQEGMVPLKVGDEIRYKHIDALTREDRPARIAVEKEEVGWLMERVRRRKELGS